MLPGRLQPCFSKELSESRCWPQQREGIWRGRAGPFSTSPVQPLFPRQFCCLNSITSPAHTEWAAFCILLLMRIAEKLKVTPKALEIGSEQQLVLKVVARCSPSPARWKLESSFLRLCVCWQRASFSVITGKVSANFPLNFKEGGSNVCF